MIESLGHKAVKGTIWATIDRFTLMVMQFVVNLILARLLLPDDFGAIGMLAIFIAVSQVLIDSGFGAALIQKKEPSQIDYSTVFYWNLGLALFLYLILFTIAPLIGIFFKMPILCNVLRVVGLTLIINATTAIQNNRLRKQLAFKTIALVNLSAYLCAGIIAIILAYKGQGVWSLVALQLVYGMLILLIFGIVTKWHPTLSFSRQSFSELFDFGGYLLAAGVLQEISKNVQGVIIGRKFSAFQMGYYSQAYKLDQISSYSIPQVIVQVMFPVYSSIQDDKQRLISMLDMNIRVISFLIFPLMAILILIAEPLISFLYGSIWLPAVPYYQILCVGGIFVCLQNINFYAVAARGKSCSLFWWSFYKWGMLLVLLLVGMNWGIIGILCGMVFSNLNIYIVNACLVSKFVGYRLSTQLRTLLPIWVVVLASTIFSFFFSIYLPNIHFLLLSVLFVIIYIGLSYIFQLKALAEVGTILNKLKMANNND